MLFTYIFSHFSHDILHLSLSRCNGYHGKAFAHRCSHICSIHAVLDCCAHLTIFSLSISCASAFDADTSTLHKTCSYLVVFSRKSKAESRILWHSCINKERYSPPQVQQPSHTPTRITPCLPHSPISIPECIFNISWCQHNPPAGAARVQKKNTSVCRRAKKDRLPHQWDLPGGSCHVPVPAASASNNNNNCVKSITYTRRGTHKRLSEAQWLGKELVKAER